MHKLFLQQQAKAAGPSGKIDLDALAKLVSAAYDESDRDRARTDRSMRLMIEELEKAHNRLLDAFEAIPEGIALFDAEDRFVLWNRRYAELVADIFDELHVGLSFEDANRAALAKGRLPNAIGCEEEWLVKRLERHRARQSTHEDRLPGNRWIRVEERRTNDGGSIGVRIDITELKRREESFRLLFDSNPVPMWVVDPKTHEFLAVNNAAIAHYGYSREQFLKMSLLDIRPPEERNNFLQFMREGKISQGGLVWKHQKADGSIIHVAAYGEALDYQGRPARLNALIDVSERKRAEEAVRRTQQFLNTIIENVPAALFVTNINDNRYVLINKMAEEFLGHPRAEVIGKTPRDFFSKEQADAIVARDRDALDTRQSARFEDYHLAFPGNRTRIIRSKRVVVTDGNSEPRYILGISEDITERQRAQEQIAHLALHDPLTNLPNRASFHERFSVMLKDVMLANGSFSVMSIDLDRFKEINDVFGHAVGDQLLCHVSDRLRAVTGNSAPIFLARLGGDEFALIAADENQPEAAESLAERLQKSVVEDFEIDGNRLRIGMSVGVAIYPTDGTDASTLLGNADAALHRAKSDGRGTIRFFEAEMDQRLRERRALQHDLSSAIERAELILNYQPQARIDGEILGFEALVRWRHPSRGIVSPGTFIPIAEESGFIIPMGEWILRTACSEAASWPRPLQIAINLSPVQFQHGDLPGLVHSVLLETGLPASRLELEITEGVLIGDFTRALSILRRLKALGVRIAMDDFGTGYSSLSYLQSFPFDKIKIDQAFISNLDRNAQSAAIVRAVVGLSHGLQLPVVAEGVETQHQLDFLQRENCDGVQGFFIGRPRPIEDYAEMVGRIAPMAQLARRAG